MINYYSYGFSLGLVKDDPSLWIADLSIGKMDGPKYINCRTFDFSTIKSNLFNLFPFYMGVGNNQFNSRIFNVNNEEIPKNILGSINYIMLGKIFSFFKIYFSDRKKKFVKFFE